MPPASTHILLFGIAMIVSLYMYYMFTELKRIDAKVTAMGNHVASSMRVLQSNNVHSNKETTSVSIDTSSPPQAGGATNAEKPSADVLSDGHEFCIPNLGLCPMDGMVSFIEILSGGPELPEQQPSRQQVTITTIDADADDADADASNNDDDDQDDDEDVDGANQGGGAATTDATTAIDDAATAIDDAASATAKPAEPEQALTLEQLRSKIRELGGDSRGNKPLLLKRFQALTRQG